MKNPPFDSEERILNLFIIKKCGALKGQRRRCNLRDFKYFAIYRNLILGALQFNIEIFHHKSQIC